MKLDLMAALFGAFLAGAAPARAQLGPSEPVTFGDGHVTISGDVSASAGPDDTGFFNYTDYEHSALRLFRADLAGAFTVNRHVSFLAELRDENLDTFGAYAFYVRIRPWADHAFDIQAGRVPPAFGTFARRAYASDNPLIGYPLAYQYLTSLRADSLPWNADDLLRMRGRGWLTAFSIGDQTPSEGVPIVTAFRFDTGVQLHAASDMLDATVAVTTGTLSNPRLTDDNSAPQVAGRLGVHPSPALTFGVSAARGPFVSSTAARGAVGDGHDGAFTQTALGADVEYSSGYYLVRGETIWSEWRLPQVAVPPIADPLRALSSYVEGRYKLRPGLYVAGRVDHLGFSDVTGTGGVQTWDAPVSRIEAGTGYSVQRNLLLKFSVQRNMRDGGRVTHATYPSVQVVYWF